MRWNASGWQDILSWSFHTSLQEKLSCDYGMEEALEKAGMVEMKPLMKWCAVELPAIGGGAWRR